MTCSPKRLAVTAGSGLAFCEARYCWRLEPALAAPPGTATPSAGSSPSSVPKGMASTLSSRYGSCAVADADWTALPAGAASKVLSSPRAPAVTDSWTPSRTKEAVGVVEAALADPDGALASTTASDTPTTAI